MKKKYFIQQFLQEQYEHGGVGGTDAEKVLLSKGFEPIAFPHHHSFSLQARISRFFFLLKMLSRLEKGSVIVFLFPVYARMNKMLLNRLARKKDITIICFIADINGLKDGDDQLLKEEILFFRQFDRFVVHNEKMKGWLNKNINDTAEIATIEFFDFLTAPFSGQRALSPAIVFAGNLEKSPFLEKLDLLHTDNPSLHFHLYGPGKTDAMTAQKSVTWHGVKKPYDLPGMITGSFGLLWDGDSIEGPGGSLGDYMQYISHHKLSLYILSGLPIIVPSTAASVALIEKYRIGFAINNLYEIEEKIKKITSEEYQQMRMNMKPLAEKISKGQCLGTAIDEIMKQG